MRLSSPERGVLAPPPRVRSNPRPSHGSSKHLKPSCRSTLLRTGKSALRPVKIIARLAVLANHLMVFPDELARGKDLRGAHYGWQRTARSTPKRPTALRDLDYFDIAEMDGGHPRTESRLCFHR